MDPSLRSFTIYERAPGRYSLYGELDMATAPQLRELDDVHGPLLLDLNGVSFLDSTGLTALLTARDGALAAGGSLQLTGTSTAVVRLLDIAGLSGIFDTRSEGPTSGGTPPSG